MAEDPKLAREADEYDKAAEQLMDKIFDATEASDLPSAEILTILATAIMREVSFIACPDCRYRQIKRMRRLLPKALRDGDQLAEELAREAEEDDATEQAMEQVSDGRLLN